MNFAQFNAYRRAPNVAPFITNVPCDHTLMLPSGSRVMLDGDARHLSAFDAVGSERFPMERDEGNFFTNGIPSNAARQIAPCACGPRIARGALII